MKQLFAYLQLIAIVAVIALCPLCKVCEGASTVTAAVFDVADQFQKYVTLEIHGQRLRDPSGYYDVVLISSRSGAPSVLAAYTRGQHRGTLALFADVVSGQVIPCFSWADYRVFSRVAASGTAPWAGLDRYEAVRPVQLSLTRPMAPLPFGHLVAYSIPAAVASSRQIEVLVCPRPAWQRRFARKIEIPLAGSATSIDVTMSHLPSSVETVPALLSNGVGHRAKLVASESSKAILFFIPKLAPTASETVRVIDSSSGSSIASWNCGSSGPAFLAPVLRERTDDSRQMTLQVNVAGLGFPLSNQPINAEILLPDGERIPFVGTTGTGCIFEWPAHCVIEGGLFELSGRVGPTNLPRAVFTAVGGDTAFDGPRGFHLERLDMNCPTPALNNLGGSIRISTRFAPSSCPTNCRRRCCR